MLPVHKSESLVAVAGIEQVGLVLLGPKVRPLYVNLEAGQILCYPEVPFDAESLKQSVSEKLLTGILVECNNSGRSTCTFTSGNRRYVCRILRLGSGLQSRGSATHAVLLERISRRNEKLRRLLQEFRLTRRERQAVMLLSEGLTSKEIAVKMNISPNTVKAFLRFIMLKLGVTTRSGILGKINEREV
jgi:DNA-binding CsgD family transcriptional regulator